MSGFWEVSEFMVSVIKRGLGNLPYSSLFALFNPFVM